VTKDGGEVERMLYAGSNLDKAREVFAEAIYLDKGAEATMNLTLEDVALLKQLKAAGAGGRTIRAYNMRLASNCSLLPKGGRSASFTSSCFPL
jgi:hypothetical protein